MKTYTPTKIETWPVKEYEAVKVWRETTVRQCFGSPRTYASRCAIWALGGDGYWAEENYAIPFTKVLSFGYCPACAKWQGLGYGMVAHWNDDHEFSFKEIADLAEMHPHLVFTEAS